MGHIRFRTVIHGYVKLTTARYCVVKHSVSKTLEFNLKMQFLTPSESFEISKNFQNLEKWFLKMPESWKSSKIMKNHEMWQAWKFVLLNWITYMVKHGSAVSGISQAQFNAILGVGNTVISLKIDTSNQSDQIGIQQFLNLRATVLLTSQCWRLRDLNVWHPRLEKLHIVVLCVRKLVSRSKTEWAHSNSIMRVPLKPIHMKTISSDCFKSVQKMMTRLIPNILCWICMQTLLSRSMQLA